MKSELENHSRFHLVAGVDLSILEIVPSAFISWNGILSDWELWPRDSIPNVNCLGWFGMTKLVLCENSNLIGDYVSLELRRIEEGLHEFEWSIAESE